MTTINDINDLVRILRENPDWADAVRGVLLSKDLLDLPETAARMAPLAAETAEGAQKALQMLEELTRHSASQGGTLTRLDGAHYQNHVHYTPLDRWPPDSTSAGPVCSTTPRRTRAQP